MREASERRLKETGARGVGMANRERKQYPWRAEPTARGQELEGLG